MKYNQLTTLKQSTANRVGRGISAGRGKTAGRGTKGQGSRKSGGVRPGFEGGQMPLYMRLPKLRGFKSKRPKAETIYTGQITKLKTQIDNSVLYEAGLVSSPYTSVKLVVNGDLAAKKEVRLQGASVAAIALIEAAGGSFKAVPRFARSKKAGKIS